MTERANRPVLVINSGSSSLKYQLVEPASGVAQAGGGIQQIGEPSSRVASHEEALRLAFEQMAESGVDLSSGALLAVGHRVVHGGKEFYRPTLVDDARIADLEKLSQLAPLHNPPAIQGIKVARKLLPDVAHVAVFDTAYFHHLPPAAATYAMDRDLAERYQIRRYGFHGTSHEYVSARGRRVPASTVGRAESDCPASG